MMASDTEFASIAQSVEHAAVNRGVVGSSPTEGVSQHSLNGIKTTAL